MQLRLHNTLTRRKEDFHPIDPNRVRLYVCGPTVYQRIHVGNARAFVVFDVLFRLLRHLYGEDHVVYVRNITDIDDKIMDQARADGEDIRALTDRTAAQFHEDLAALGCLPPTHEPRATEHVGGMVALIEELIARGHAYAAEGHVLFSVPSMPDYGRLSGRNRDEQIAGARVDVAPYKRDPADFVLWKPSAENQPGWDSPWGYGRPGWHIECSAMSEAFLGPLPFDIHAGGLDLIFPHHENEIAQSCCARGIDSMARFWLHNGFLDMRGEKMSKSVGNVVRVPEALAAAPGEAVRLHLLATHYRQPADFTEDALHEAKRMLDRFYGALERVSASNAEEPHPEVLAALGDDLNTPRALVTLHDLVGEVNRSGSSFAASVLRASGAVLGLLKSDPDHWLKGNRIEMSFTGGGRGSLGYTDRQIAELIGRRHAARRGRDFRTADQIRDDLKQYGVILEDRPDGTTDWRRA
ncbi:MAG: cysteine--tRNA ligase [Geminicoccaceae bacterium]